jgi:exodeoxyribonuclease-5
MTTWYPAAGPDLSSAQRDVLHAIARWHGDGGWPPLTLGGLAGTGKTTLIGRLAEVLPRAEIAYAAYTGKAVSVMTAKLAESGVGADRISTLHRLLYSPQPVTVCTESEVLALGEAGRCGPHLARPGPCPVRQQVSFTPRPDPLDGLDLVVADEASMIPERLWADLTGYGVPVLAVGDHGQLPPVRSAFYLMASPDLRLEQIHRQDAANPTGMAILNMARWAREQGRIPHGWYGPDVVKITPGELCRAGLHPGESDMIICATNATRQYHNAAMRAWAGRSGPPQAGDVVTCLRNNYDAGLFNGMRGTILAVTGSTSVRGEPAWKARIGLEGLDAPWAGAMSAAQFGAAGTLSGLPRDMALFDYGYAQTAHKSQGASAGRVLVIEEGWPPPGLDRSRWLYTAVTRATTALTVVGT